VASRDSLLPTVVLWAFGCVALGAGLGAIAAAFSFPAWIAGAAVPIAAPFVWRLVRGGTGAR